MAAGDEVELPGSVRKYLINITTRTRDPAYLHMDEGGNVIDWGGEIEKYGILGVEKGMDVNKGALKKQLYFLEGLLPAKEKASVIPAMETEAGQPMDVHIYADSDGQWIILLDATLERERRRMIQQKVNDLELLINKLTKLLE